MVIIISIYVAPGRLNQTMLSLTWTLPEHTIIASNMFPRPPAATAPADQSVLSPFTELFLSQFWPGTVFPA